MLDFPKHLWIFDHLLILMCENTICFWEVFSLDIEAHFLWLLSMDWMYFQIGYNHSCGEASSLSWFCSYLKQCAVSLAKHLHRMLKLGGKYQTHLLLKSSEGQREKPKLHADPCTLSYLYTGVLILWPLLYFYLFFQLAMYIR